MAAQKYKQKGGVQSRQEELVKRAYGGIITFKPSPITYTMHHEYNPDFLLGYSGSVPVYLECKEYMTLKDCPKYEAIQLCNPNVAICFLIKAAPTAVIRRLQKQGFDTHIGEFVLPERWLNFSKEPTCSTSKSSPQEASTVLS